MIRNERKRTHAPPPLEAGGDFADELEKADTVPEALRSWTERFERNAEHCREIANKFGGKDVEAYAAVYHIGFYGDEKVLEKAAEKRLLEVVEFAESESHGKAGEG